MALNPSLSATPIVQPQRQSISSKIGEILTLKKTMQAMKDDEASRELFRTATTREELLSGARKTSPQNFMDLTEHFSRMDTQTLQQNKIRLETQAELLKDYSAKLRVLSERAKTDPYSAKLLLPQLSTHYREAGLDKFFLPPPDADIKYIDALSHASETAAEHARHAADQASLVEKNQKIEFDKAEEDRRIAAANRSAEEHQIKITGIKPEFNAEFKEFLTSRDIDPSTLNPQSEAALRQELREIQAKRGQKPSFEELSYEDFLKDPQLVAKYGTLRTGYNKYKSDTTAENQRNFFLLRDSTYNPTASIDPELSTALDRATTGIRSPSQRRYIIERANSMADDPEELKSYIRQAALEGADPQTRRRIEGLEDASTALSEIQTIYNDYKAKGKNTNLFVGSLEDIARRLGTTNDPELVDFATRVTRVLNNYTLAMSGVQFAIKEQEMYAKIFPNTWNTNQVNDTLIKSLLGTMKTEKDGFWKRRLGEDGARAVGAVDGSKDGGSDNNSGMVRVQIPGFPPGTISRSALQQFLKDNPGAKELK